MEGIEKMKVKVGSVTYEGTATPEEVIARIESQTRFKVATP